MSLSASSVGVNEAHALTARRSRYRVAVASDWGAVDAAWRADEDSAAATPFQSADWYAAIYAAIREEGRDTPLIVSVTDAESGQMAMRLPLLISRSRGLRVVTFADRELTDYNAPPLGPAAPTTPKGAAALWREVVRVLPPADVIRFRKMPQAIEGRPNPLSLLKSVRHCPANGNLLQVGEDWEAHRFAREKTFRKELERSWRVFVRDPSARFVVAADAAEGLRLLDSMEQQQSERMHSVGVDYLLDGPLESQFYRDLVTRGIPHGYAWLSALTTDEGVVAALLGIRRRDTYVMIRISNAAGKWSNISPGRLVIEQTMAHLHAQGVRRFDFSIGNYAYKRRFGVAGVPLLDCTQPLSVKGIPVWLRDRAAAKLRQYPGLRDKIQRALGRSASREEASA